MPVTVTEKQTSRTRTKGEQEACELEYVVEGTADDLVAHTNLLATAPTTYDGLPRTGSSIRWIADNVHEGVVFYGFRQAPSDGDSIFEFDTGGGTQHITHAPVVSSYSAGGVIPNHQGAIGVTKDAVDGVDIVVPAYAWSERHFKPASFVTSAYRQTLFQLTGKINQFAFRDFGVGECLFLGCRGSERIRGVQWELTYSFAGSATVTNKTIGAITGINKLGWDYLWVSYREEGDSPANAIVKRPAFVYVHRVYEFANFASLGI